MVDFNAMREKLHNRLMEADPEDQNLDGEDEMDLFSDDELDAPEDNPDAENTDTSEDNPEDAPEDTTKDETPQESFSSDEDKVNKLFQDTGNPEYDYSLTNPNNIRLFTFKFKNAGIDPFALMNETEKTEGVRSDELESRLTPDQYEVYLEKNSELRKTYELIRNREKRVAVYNSNTPLMINDDNGNPKLITHPNDQTQAIQKVVDYMDRNFGEDWFDNNEAVGFLQNIKVNFSQDPKIRPNLVSITMFSGQDDSLIPFNKLYADVPESVSDFIKENQDSEEYKKSSIFRTLVDDYVGSGVGGSRISIYPVIRSADGGSEEDTDADVDNTDQSDESGGGGDFGGGGGSEDFGGEDLSTDEFGDEGDTTAPEEDNTGDEEQQ